MNEEEAKESVAGRIDVSHETFVRLEKFISLLLGENQHHNLIARSTIDHIWVRHIVDSIQLVDHLGSISTGPTVDLGSGAGLPGLVLALIQKGDFTLIDSRKRRCAFLLQAVSDLNLTNVSVVCRNLKTLQPFVAGAITARAFAPLRVLIDMARPFSDASTRWVLPRGANGVREWQDLPKRHKAMFHVEQSITDEQAVILVGEGAP